MRASERLAEYLRQMTQGATDTLTFTDGMDEDDFLADLRTQRAVVMSLMIVGEAANRVADYPDFAEANSGILWRSMRGMRSAKLRSGRRGRGCRSRSAAPMSATTATITGGKANPTFSSIKTDQQAQAVA